MENSEITVEHDKSWLGDDDQRSDEVVVLTRFNPNDPESPQNFSFQRKIFHTIVLSFMTFCSTMSSSILTPGVPDMTAKYHVSSEVSTLSTGLVLLGYAIGSIIWSPINEAFGRKYAWTPSFFLFTVFQIPTGIDPNLQTLLVSRFIQGLCGICSIISLGACMNDIWNWKSLSYIFSFNLLCIFASPTLGPLIGAFLVQWVNFGWLSWLPLIMSGVALILHIFVKETYPPILLKRKAIRLRSDGKRVQAAIEETPPTLQNMMTKYIIRPFVMLIDDKALLFMCTYSSIAYGLLYAFFVAFPIAFAEYRDFGSVATYIPNLSVMIGVILTTILVAMLNPRYVRVCEAAGKVDPEERLLCVLIAGVGLPIGLIIFAWTGSFKWVHWIVPCIAGVIMGFSTSGIFLGAVLYMVDVYREYSASALAANGILRALLAMLFVLTIRLMIERMTFQGAFSFFAAVGLVVLPGPFILKCKGAQWRSQSKWGHV
jgi:DHA1 family multidrug resistance protein-like MFS transporter